MRQWFLRLFRPIKQSSRGSAPASPRRQARLSVEVLEVRQVMTAALGAAAALHQVVPPPSAPAQARTIQAAPTTNGQTQFNMSQAQTLDCNDQHGRHGSHGEGQHAQHGQHGRHGEDCHSEQTPQPGRSMAGDPCQITPQPGAPVAGDPAQPVPQPGSSVVGDPGQTPSQPGSPVTGDPSQTPLQPGSPLASDPAQTAPPPGSSVATDPAQTPTGPESIAAGQDAGRSLAHVQADSKAPSMSGMQEDILFRNTPMTFQQADPMKVQPISSAQLAEDIRKFGMHEFVQTQLSPQEQSDALKVRPLGSSQLAQDLSRLDLSPTSLTTPALGQTPSWSWEGLGIVQYARERANLPPLGTPGGQAGPPVGVDDFPGHSNFSCANFVASVLRHMNAYDFSNLPNHSHDYPSDGEYVWSNSPRLIYDASVSPTNPDFSSVQPGDVIQFRDTTGVSLNGGAPNTDSSAYHQHTAIIEQNLGNGKFLVLEQNMNHQPYVTEDTIDLSAMNGGRISIYQPDVSPTPLPPADPTATMNA